MNFAVVLATYPRARTGKIRDPWMVDEERPFLSRHSSASVLWWVSPDHDTDHKMLSKQDALTVLAAHELPQHWKMAIWGLCKCYLVIMKECAISS